ncbi:hypothetical protein EV360DRAFT_88080 [Lentinula raphanica]|nr:hypothetical protein EV360DRAFT_88080 [Lentinula raphanica]
MAEPPTVNPGYYRSGNKQNDPPPAYTPSQSANAQPAESRMLTFDIPLNSNVVGATQTLDSVQICSTSSFNDAYTLICERMGVSVDSASLGFKWNRETGNPHSFKTNEDWEACVARGCDYQRRARTRAVVCHIFNLEQPNLASAHVKATSGSNKRKCGPAPDSSRHRLDTPSTGFSLEDAQLREFLRCETHKQFCFIMHDTQDVRVWHEKVEEHELTLWAKLLARARETGEDNPTLTVPPTNMVFQRFFYQAKRPRIDSARPGRTRGMPDVHIHNHYSSSLPAVAPPANPSPPSQSVMPASTGHEISNPAFLTDKGGQRLTNQPASFQSIQPISSTLPTSSFTPSLPEKRRSDETLFSQPATPLDQVFAMPTESWGTSASAEKSMDNFLQDFESTDDSVVVTYPSVMSALSLMDRRASSSSAGSMTAFHQVLMEYGLGYVHHVTLLACDHDFFVHVIGMPQQRIVEFIDICRTFTLRAKQSQT